jgi:hypothetical protein
MSSSKKIDLWKDFAAGVYLSEAQNPLSLPHILYTVNIKLIHTGKGRKALFTDLRILIVRNIWNGKFS